LNTISQNNRVLSGMRPTGLLHLGHYHGVLKNWIELQHSYECFFFVADWHALTTHYEDPSIIAESTRDMVIDWLAAGVNPGSTRVTRPCSCNRAYPNMPNCTRCCR
jgi:tryptophanyl-tRNA synthetase